VPTRLADHADYRITFHPSGKADPGPLVVTFGGQPSGLGDSGFGTDFCARNGWDHIHVAQRSATQFQGLDLEAFEAATAELAAGRDVVCYGASLGGYAAFYYGGCLNARIIAAAPMLPLWPPMRNRAFADAPYLHRPLEHCPRSSALPVIILDPLLRRDMFFVEQMILPVYPAARIVKVPHGGHTVLITLSRARLLTQLIIPLIVRDEIIAFDPPGEGTGRWHMERGRVLAPTDLDAAIAEIETSLRLDPSRQAFCVLVNLLMRKGDLGVVQELLDKARLSGDRRLRVVPAQREKLRAAGLSVGDG
jgi:hypothetical protein